MVSEHEAKFLFLIMLMRSMDGSRFELVASTLCGSICCAAWRICSEIRTFSLCALLNLYAKFSHIDVLKPEGIIHVLSFSPVCGLGFQLVVCTWCAAGSDVQRYHDTVENMIWNHNLLTWCMNVNVHVTPVWNCF
jgi:hypothetical protein